MKYQVFWHCWSSNWEENWVRFSHSGLIFIAGRCIHVCPSLLLSNSLYRCHNPSTKIHYSKEPNCNLQKNFHGVWLISSLCHFNQHFHLMKTRKCSQIDLLYPWFIKCPSYTQNKLPLPYKLWQRQEWVFTIGTFMIKRHWNWTAKANKSKHTSFRTMYKPEVHVMWALLKKSLQTSTGHGFAENVLWTERVNYGCLTYLVKTRKETYTMLDILSLPYACIYLACANQSNDSQHVLFHIK